MKMNQGDSVVNIQPESGRPELSIDEACRLTGWTVADFYYKGSSGELKIYVLADHWKARLIHSIDHLITTEIPHEVLGQDPLLALALAHGHLRLSFSGPTPQPVPDTTDNPEFDLQLEAWRNNHDCRDMTIENHTTYSKHGAFRLLYDISWSDLQPIRAETFKDYRAGNLSAMIQLDIKRMIESPNADVEYYLEPETDLLLSDALERGILFVMSEDVSRLVQDTPQAIFSEWKDHKYWPPELALAISAWLYARDKYKPGDHPKEIIREWLNGRKIDNEPLQEGAVERIATVSNWKKGGGRKKKSPEMGGE